MRRWLVVIVAAGLLTGLQVTGAAAQVTPDTADSSAGHGVLGSATNGNTTIIFAAANPADLNVQHLTAWDEFAGEHPGIAHALAYNPSLMNDPGYLKKHPELNDFFQAHPEVREAMAADPGNFSAIPPRPGE